MKSTTKFNTLFFTFITLAISAYAQSSREQLKQLTTELQQSPNDDALREKIIKLAVEMKPTPAIPPEAKRPFVMAGTYQKEAKSPVDFALAIEAYQEALKIAPWWGDAYYNLSVSLESAGRLDEAKVALNRYLLTGPKDADEAQNRIYALEAKKTLVIRQASEADAAAKATADASARERAKTLIIPGVGIGGVRIGMSESQVTAVKGAPLSRETVFGDRGRIQITYPDLGFFVVAGEVVEVQTSHREFVMNEAIRVGSSMSDIMAAMGSPDRKEITFPGGPVRWNYRRGISFKFDSSQSMSEKAANINVIRPYN